MKQVTRKNVLSLLPILLFTIFFASAYYYIADEIVRHAKIRMRDQTHLTAALVWNSAVGYINAVTLLSGLDEEHLENSPPYARLLKMQNIVYLDKEGRLAHAEDTTGRSVPVSDAPPQWQHALDTATHTVTCIGPLPPLEGDGPMELLFTRKFSSGEARGALGISISLPNFANDLHRQDFLNNEGKLFYLVGADGQMLASSKRDDVARQNTTPPPVAILAASCAKGGSNTLTASDTEYLVGSATISQTGWTFYLLSPKERELAPISFVATILGIGWLVMILGVLLLRHFAWQQDKYKQLSQHDHMTGAMNRLAFEKKLEELQHSGNYPICLLVMDVDGLKTINDALGHEAGDALLRRVMLLLQRSLRDEDAVYRLGGDEFAVILSDAHYSVAQQLAERITVQAAMMREKTGLSPIFLSLGFAEAKSPEAVGSLFARADEAMYSNKRIRKDAAHRAINRWIKNNPQLHERRKPGKQEAPEE
ncbi:sensor domain-containing diguanylate cyclase [Desulfovibrio sp. OttesenSCG-928-G15]|nr:sensor domain-containing diguanylate cyclase [Desulfovibrio sp. OttesenSCG-928-G15]